MTLRRLARWAGLGFAWAACAVSPAAAGEPLDWPALEDEAVRLLSRYLQIDTSNPPGNELRGAAFFQALFEREGIESQIVESAPGRGNVVARLRGDGTRPAVVLMHHMDVVPADARFWQAPPFGGEIRDGTLWGRGALDTKAMGITNAMALLALARSGSALGGDVVFLGVADEEAGGALGAGFLVEHHFDWFEGAGVVLNEGGYIAVDDAGEVQFYGVEVAQKTPLWLRLTATGTPGHGSMPRADSSAVRLVAALHRITGHSTPLRVVPEVQRFYADTAHLQPGPGGQALRDLRSALLDADFAAAFTRNLRQNAQVRDTISVTVLQGSSKTNVIPPQAVAELDVRLLPDRPPEAFLAELRRVIDDESIAIETILSFPPASSPADHELFRVLREIAAQRHPDAVVTTPMAVGFTDCHYFRERDIPCYGFAPFEVGERDIPLIHGNDERISVANVARGTRLTWQIVSRLAGVSQPGAAPSFARAEPGD